MCALTIQYIYIQFLFAEIINKHHFCLSLVNHLAIHLRKQIKLSGVHETV